MEQQEYALPAVTYSPFMSTSLLNSNAQTPGLMQNQPQPWQQQAPQQPWQQVPQQRGMQQPGSPRMVQYERDIYTKKKKTSIVGCYPLLVFAVIAMILLFVTIFIPGSATTKILSLVIAMIFAIIFALLIWLTCRIGWLSWGMVVLATIIWITMLVLVYNNIVKVNT